MDPAVDAAVGRKKKRNSTAASYLFVAPYSLMLMAFAVIPGVYVVYLSFVKENGSFAGLENFVRVAKDYRFASSMAHIGLFAAVFLIPSVLIALVIALMMQQRSERSASIFQLIYYIPQGFIGAAGVVIWLFILTPAVSPIGLILHAFGLENMTQVVASLNLAVVFAIIAVWVAGNSILLMYAALKAVPDEVLEAARVDGAGAWRTAVSIQIPMIRKWIAYIVILSVAGCLQLFVEPALISGATNQALGTNWSPLQLAYTFAYQYNNFNAAGALSLELLAASVIAAIAIISRTKLFSIEI